MGINFTSGCITVIAARRSGDLQIENILCGPRHNSQHTMWPPEVHEFNTPGLDNKLSKKCSNERYIVTIVSLCNKSPNSLVGVPLPDHHSNFDFICQPLLIISKNISFIKVLHHHHLGSVGFWTPYTAFFSFHHLKQQTKTIVCT